MAKKNGNGNGKGRKQPKTFATNIASTVANPLLYVKPKKKKK